jgi:glycosyltransferase involved in cell wall biosynthesis
MNVLLITKDADVLEGGSSAQKAVLEQAQLANRLMVVVLNSHSRKSNSRKIKEGIWVFPTNSWFPLLKYFDALRVIRREIFYRNRLQADLIVANDPVSSAVVAISASRKYKRPLHIYVQHNIFSFYYVTRSPLTLFKSILARVNLSFSNSVSVANDTIRAALIRQDPYFAERATVIPPYVEVTSANEQLGSEDLHVKYTQFRALLLVVCPLTAEHNVKLAIDVLKKVSEDHRYVGLVIVGAGWGKWPLKWYAAKKGVAKQVMFESPRDDLTSFYKTAFALLVPSFTTQFESTIEDAAAAGCVIISSPVGIAPKLIQSKENGYLCDPRSMIEYVDAVNNLINNEAVRSTMRKRITESVHKIVMNDKQSHILSRKKAWEAAIVAARGY